MSATLVIRDDGPLERIARAMRARLELAFPQERFVHHYLPDRISLAWWQRIMKKTPVVGIGWAKFSPHARAPGKLFTGEVMFPVYLVISNPRGIEERYFGDRMAPGLLKMVRAAIAVLHGAPVPGVGTLQVADCSNAHAENYDEEGMALAMIDVTCTAGLSVSGALDVPPAPTLQEVDITWSFAGDAAGALTDTDATEAS